MVFCFSNNWMSLSSVVFCLSWIFWISGKCRSLLVICMNCLFGMNFGVGILVLLSLVVRKFVFCLWCIFCLNVFVNWFVICVWLVVFGRYWVVMFMCISYGLIISWVFMVRDLIGIWILRFGMLRMVCCLCMWWVFLLCWLIIIILMGFWCWFLVCIRCLCCVWVLFWMIIISSFWRFRNLVCLVMMCCRCWLSGVVLRCLLVRLVVWFCLIVIFCMVLMLICCWICVVMCFLFIIVVIMFVIGFMWFGGVVFCFWFMDSGRCGCCNLVWC